VPPRPSRITARVAPCDARLITFPLERWPKLGVNRVVCLVGLIDGSSNRWTNAPARLILRSTARRVTG
jgi:hypothetical protein